MLQTTHSILSLPPSTTLSFYPHLTDPLQNQLSHRNKYVSASAPDRAPLLPPEYPQASLQLHYGDLITLAARPEEQVSPRAREKCHRCGTPCDQSHEPQSRCGILIDAHAAYVV